jgi:hypothetical protein
MELWTGRDRMSPFSIPSSARKANVTAVPAPDGGEPEFADRPGGSGDHPEAIMRRRIECRDLDVGRDPPTTRSFDHLMDR